MKIIVCMKQMPAGTKVDIDLETGAAESRLVNKHV